MPSRQAALLRGVNVGGRSLLPAARQRALALSLGLADVDVVLQTGNIVFADPGIPPDRTARALQDAVTAELGRPMSVTVRTGPELAAVVGANPFPEAVAEPRTLHVVFLAAEPADPDAFAALAAGSTGPDTCRLVGREVFLWCPGGVGRSPLAAKVSRAGDRLAGAATARNWNTVSKLAARTAGP